MDQDELLAAADQLLVSVNERISVLEAEVDLLDQSIDEMKNRRQHLRSQICELEAVFSSGCTDH